MKKRVVRLCQKVCRVGGAISFTNFGKHSRLNHSTTALVARVHPDQSHGSAWGASATHYTLYALKELWLLHRRPSHPVVHQMSLHPDYHQWATGGPPDVATSSGPPDVALAVGTRMLACGCNADADIKWPTGCTHPVVHPMCTHAVVHRMRASTGHEDVRCWSYSFVAMFWF